jgi:amino acid permease
MLYVLLPIVYQKQMGQDSSSQYNWIIIMPAELSAAAVLINLWNQTVNNAVWITVCLVVVVVINFLGAGVYGECEFWFASIKVLTIVGLILLGIIITAGGGPDGKSIGFQYWRDPGPFTRKSSRHRHPTSFFLFPRSLLLPL